MGAQHTPGPFAYKPDRTIHDALGTPLARCYADRNEAGNGPLFAAAPQLLDMLEMFVDAAKPRGPDGHHEMPRFSATEIDIARAAIAKAKGGAE